MYVPVEVIGLGTGAFSCHSRRQAGGDAHPGEVHRIPPARIAHPEILGGHEREPEVYLFQAEAGESPRHYPDHRDRGDTAEKTAETQVEGAAQDIRGPPRNSFARTRSLLPP